MADPEHPLVDVSVFFDLALDLLCIAGVDGYFKRVNHSFERVLGWSRDELLAQPFLELVHPEDRESTMREVDRLSQGSDTVNFENRYRCKDGSWRWLAWTCPAPPPGSGLLYSVARDVTQQRMAERELRIRDSILTSMQNGLVITDPCRPDNPIIYCNPAFCEQTGYSPDEAIGRNCRFLQGDDHAQPQIGELREALASGRSCRVLLRNYRKNGSLFWNDLVVSPVRDEQGKLTHFVALQHDISQTIEANRERSRDIVDRLETLAPRQREVLDRLVLGKNTKSIARELALSPKTVEIHRARVLDKMGVDSAVDLVRLMIGSQPWIGGDADAKSQLYE